MRIGRCGTVTEHKQILEALCRSYEATLVENMIKHNRAPTWLKVHMHELRSEMEFLLKELGYGA